MQFSMLFCAISIIYSFGGYINIQLSFANGHLNNNSNHIHQLKNLFVLSGLASV